MKILKIFTEKRFNNILKSFTKRFANSAECHRINLIWTRLFVQAFMV